MFNDLYIEVYITLANNKTFIIFIFCAMSNNKLQQYILAEGKENAEPKGSWQEAKETSFSATATMFNDVWQRGGSSNAPIKIICKRNHIEKKMKNK